MNLRIELMAEPQGHKKEEEGHQQGLCLSPAASSCVHASLHIDSASAGVYSGELGPSFHKNWHI